MGKFRGWSVWDRFQLRQAEEAPGLLEHVGEIAEPKAVADYVEEVTVSSFRRIGVMLNST